MPWHLRLKDVCVCKSRFCIGSRDVTGAACTGLSFSAFMSLICGKLSDFFENWYSLLIRHCQWRILIPTSEYRHREVQTTLKSLFYFPVSKLERYHFPRFKDAFISRLELELNVFRSYLEPIFTGLLRLYL